MKTNGLHKKLYIVVLYGLYFLFSCVNIYPQSKTGTTIGQFLKIEPSARAVGLGNAGVSLSGEASLLFYNPASLGRLQGVDVQFTYNKWLADIQYNYAVAAMNISSIGTFSLVITSLNSGEIDVRTVEKPLGTGERYTVNDFSLGLAYGLMLTDRVSVGLQVNYINESIWHSSLNAFGMNFGVQYQLMDGDFTIGASVSNFGTRASFNGRDLYINYDFDPKKYGDNDRLPAELRTDEYSLPTIFRAGISYLVKFSDSYKLLVSADAVHPNDNNESINIGGELNLIDMITLRAGYRNLFMPDLEGGLVLGAGVKTKIGNFLTAKFDYAWADYGVLQEAHRITVGVSF
ncbi:PorV/PorQ family protein [Melioribacteraceae bacterium 4301-Me]|uniref:PorV/PorQ family protein n=1 Tax=Pyranulibacter aquaticus TaxID=3163344 RepID=UPI0035961726